jgi:hypothetical protein
MRQSRKSSKPDIQASNSKTEPPCSVTTAQPDKTSIEQEAMKPGTWPIYLLFALKLWVLKISRHRPGFLASEFLPAFLRVSWFPVKSLIPGQSCAVQDFYRFLECPNVL